MHYYSTGEVFRAVKLGEEEKQMERALSLWEPGGRESRKGGTRTGDKRNPQNGGFQEAME